MDLPFLETSSSTRCSKFCISEGKLLISLSLRLSFLKRCSRKKFCKTKWKLLLFSKYQSFSHPFTFGKDWILFASSKSSSKLLEYLSISSGTLTKEQCLLSTNSTCLLQPLNIGIQRNMSQVNLELALSIILLNRLYPVACTIRVNLCTLFEQNTIFSSKTLFYTVTKTLHISSLSTIYNEHHSRN